MKILVVGLGLVAQKHIRNIKTLETLAEIGCWRQRPDPPGWTPPEGLPVDRWLYDRDEIWRWGAQAAVIANPSPMHMATALHPLIEGLHLFIEKPLADGFRVPSWGGRNEVDALLQLARRTGRVVMVGYDLRFFKPLQLVKAAIDAGRIGRPLSIRCEVGQYLPDWRPGRDYRTSVSARQELGGGVLLELSHEIDYARWLMGEVLSVSSHIGKFSDLQINVEETADVLLYFRNGALGNIHLDMVDRAPVRRCRVVGTEGSIECDLRTWEAWLCGPGKRRQLHYRAGPREEPFLLEMRHFLACCRGEAEPPVSGEEGRRVLEIALAARRSAEEEREVKVGG